MIRTERVRQKLGQRPGQQQLPLRVDHVNRQFRQPEFPQFLPASPAWRARRIPTHDHDFLDPTSTTPHHGSNRARLGTGPKRIGRVLNITAGMNNALTPQCGPNLKARIGCVSTRTGLKGLSDQFLYHADDIIPCGFSLEHASKSDTVASS